jgi:uncharacterized oxidoreductase
MELKNNKILVTGGSSGLGLEMCRRLLETGNSVIACSRSAEKLSEAKRQLPGLITCSFDISEAQQCILLAEWIKKQHPDLNILINNAAIVYNTKFASEEEILEKSQNEMNTNLMAPIWLSKLLLPVLETQKNPAIINITTGLIYAPKADYLFYNAGKSALHAFSQVLRMQMQNHTVKIIEVMFPVVDTPWHKGNPPKIAIQPEQAINEMLEGLKKNKAEIKVGGVKLLYWLSRIAPGFAIRKINNLKR